MGGCVGVTLSALMDLQHHNFPPDDLFWDNNLTSSAYTALQVLHFLPHDMGLNVHKFGAMG